MLGMLKQQVLKMLGMLEQQSFNICFYICGVDAFATFSGSTAFTCDSTADDQSAKYGDSGGEPASVGVCRLSRRGRRVSVFGLCGDAAATTYDGTVVIACGDFGGLECVGRDERDRRHGMAIERARNDDGSLCSGD
ncbi:hypothetical protein ACFE04_013366 [Oxalis oulophora]